MGAKLKEEDLNKLIGINFGRLKITKYLGHYKNTQKTKQHWFLCNCDCGNKNVIKSYQYLHNDVKIKSCGCWNIEHTIMFNKETKTNFDNKYIINEDGSCIIYANRWGKEFEVIVDKNFLNFLKSLNRKLQIDSRGYAFITRTDNTRQLFIHNLVIFGFDYYDKNMNILVDHIITKNIRDNRKSNLRPADDFENTHNTKRRKDNTTGIKGFCISRPKDMIKIKIRVRIEENYKRIGKTFDLSQKGLEDAIRWNLHKRKELHDEFTNYGFDINNKTEEEIIKEQSEIFIHNLNNIDKHYFFNQIRLDK